MSPWVTRSIRLAQQDDYLDQIQEVYPAGPAGQRDLPAETIQRIVQAHTDQNGDRLLQAVLKLERSPIDDIRLGFLRTDPNGLARNPETATELGQRLLNLELDELLRRCRRAKATNTRMGNMFYDWFTGLPYPALSREDFLETEEMPQIGGPPHRIFRLDGTPAAWKQFANSELDCGLDKEPDLLAKAGSTYVVGEAKWLGHFGGNQNNHFEEAISFVHTARGDATRVAVLDGVVWLDTLNKMNRRIRRVESIALTALLLPTLLDSIAGSES